MALSAPPGKDTQKHGNTGRGGGGGGICSYHHQGYRVVMLLLMLIAWCGVYCFVRGFLLTRLELESKSTCRQQQQQSGTAEILLKNFNFDNTANTAVNVENDGDNAEKRCIGGRQFDRVVLFIIDALRYDFLDIGSNDSYSGHIPFCREKMRTEPDRSLLFQFVADAPTTTSQRLKGMTTGSLPTFVDAGKNFDSDEVVEDNMIYQLVRHGRRIVALGDDTWKHLYPAKSTLLADSEHFFVRSRLLPSFNVWDLHTVDDGVLRYLDTELTALSQQQIEELYTLHNDSDHTYGEIHDHDPHWDVLIAHFLGVDHAGHRYGVHHPEMHAKLRQMNDVLERTAANLPVNTLLLVFGDHGMNDNGDHGGGSDVEVNSALFAYSRDRPLTDLRFAVSNDNRIVPESDHEAIRSIQQIDLVPTMSFLLDVPIPYGNLGAVNPELAFGMDFSGCRDHTHASSSYSLWQAIIAMHINAGQMMRYLEEYHGHNPLLLPQDEYRSLQIQFTNTSNAVLEIGRQISIDSQNCSEFVSHLDLAVDLQKLHDLFHGYTSLCGKIAMLCRERWATFDEPLMYSGLAIMSIVFILMLLSLISSHADSNGERIPLVLIMACVVAIILIIFTLVLEFVEPLRHAQLLEWIPVISEIRLALVCILLSSFIFFFALPNMTSIARKVAGMVRSVSIESALGHFALFCLFISLQSNSFIVYEDRLVIFFLVTFGIVTLARSYSKFTTVNLTVILIYFLCIRLSSLTMRFRSHGTHHILNNQSASQMDSMKISLFAAINALLHMAYHYLDKPARGEHRSRNIVVIMLKDLTASTFTPVMSTLIVLFWFVSANQELMGPDLATAMTTMGFSSSLVDTWNLSVADLNLWLPRIVYFLSFSWLALIALILLFARSPSHVRALFSIIFTTVQLPLMMLKGHVFASTFVIMTVQVLCFVFMVRKRVIKPNSLFALVNWYLIAVQFFFATGQQNTFNTIQWTSAFVGIDDAQLALSGVLVTITAFSTKLLNVLALPWAIVGNPSDKVEKGSVARQISSNLTRSICQYWMFHLFLCIGSTLCVMIQRRHLMVWSIFAPKFIFDVLSLGVVTAMLTVVSVLGRG